MGLGLGLHMAGDQVVELPKDAFGEHGCPLSLLFLFLRLPSGLGVRFIAFRAPFSLRLLLHLPHVVVGSPVFLLGGIGLGFGFGLGFGLGSR